VSLEIPFVPQERQFCTFNGAITIKNVSSCVVQSSQRRGAAEPTEQGFLGSSRLPSLAGSAGTHCIPLGMLSLCLSAALVGSSDLMNVHNARTMVAHINKQLFL